MLWGCVWLAANLFCTQFYRFSRSLSHSHVYFIFRFRLKGGRELPDDIRQKVQGDGSLVISPVQKQDDSGVYTCWARNKQGHSARRSGEVTVIGKVFLLINSIPVWCLPPRNT